MISDILNAAVESFGVVLILMLIDLLTGLWKALKGGSKITSSKLRNSVNKLIVYFIVIIIGGCVKHFGEQSVMTMLLVFIVVIEGVSILENLQEICPKLDFIGRLKEILNTKKNKQ